jgi:two-component system, NarL family, nitrate/nitrite response regulator NarL
MPPGVSSPPSALLVSPDALVRAALRDLLARGGWAMAGEVDSLSAVPSAWLELSFDAVLWDAHGAQLRTEVPEGPPLLALVDDEGTARRLLAAGVAGAVARASAPDTVSAALWAVAHGLHVSEASLELVRPLARAPALPGDFTKREREVLGLLAEGLSNRAIAERLSISRHTVKFHVNALLQKLGVEGRTEAVVRAARLGLVVL